MRGEDIVECLNRFIVNKRKELNIGSHSHLVLHKTVLNNSTFKVYKTYTNILWYVKGSHKYKVFEVSITDKVPVGQEDAMIKNIDLQLCYAIMEWMNTE